ncbi:MAG TPA: hypothetical protein VKB73_09370 [Gaiellaceae bacterium]|nr:hypothetical protein [Gaiellaceae bacterium]
MTVTDTELPRSTSPRAASAAMRVAALRQAIEALVAARQEMRAHGASCDDLESNRLELGTRQRQLSCALIERVLPESGACGAWHEPERLRRPEPVLADERLAA